MEGAGAGETEGGGAPWTLRGGGAGVLRGAGGEAGPEAALRLTDWGLEPASTWAEVTEVTEAKGSEPGAVGLELKKDIGEVNIEEAGGGGPSLVEDRVTGGPSGG